MKDSKFIELLNLYVDHQITDADAAMLEAEIQQNPKRRQVYRQYCRMQKACAVLAENFRTEAPAPADSGKIVEFTPQRRSILRGAYAVGALAAAACIATVVLMNRQADRSSSLANTDGGGGGIHLASAPVRPVEGPASRQPLQRAFTVMPRENALATVTTADGKSLDWIKGVQLTRVTPDEVWFQARPAKLQNTDLKLPRTLDDSGDSDPMVALLFHK